MDEAERARVVAAYWRHHALIGAGSDERVSADDFFWAWGVVDDTVREAPAADVIVLLDDLLHAAAADPCYLGAGALEDLLERRSREVLVAVAERCREDALWRAALTCVWVSEPARAALEAELGTWLPHR